MTAICALAFASCEKVDTKEPSDPSVLRVRAGENLAEVLASLPSGIRSVHVDEGVFTGPFTMVRGIDVVGSGKGTVLTVESGRVISQDADFDTLTTWSNLSVRGGRLDSDNGAGVLLRKNGVLKDCYVYDNRAEGASAQGGGIWAAEGSVVTGCSVYGNYARNAGGGIYSKGLVTWCVIENNEAPDNVGGGIQLHGGSSANNANGTMYNCVIKGNSSKNAGGVRLYGNTQVANLLVEANTATAGGVSGILVNGVSSIVNCTVVKNVDAADGGNSSALYINQNGTIKNCLVFGNYSKSKTADQACQIFVNHKYTWLKNNAVTDGGLRMASSYDPNGDGRNTDLVALPASSKNIFVDYERSDYNLTDKASMLIDKGNTALFGFMVLDAAGAPRRYGHAPDIGAYEYPTPVPAGGYTCCIIGDSIFDRWDTEGIGHPAFFPEHDIINSGISGQTTDQMLLRFEGSVLYYKPKKIVLEGGTNDITRVQTWESADAAYENIKAMAVKAKKSGAEVYISSILPCNAAQTGSISVRELISSTNERLKALAKSEKYTYVDFYSSLSNQDGSFIDAYNSDGVHPNAAGYDIMEPILLKALGLFETL